jgi:hypothetical protein
MLELNGIPVSLSFDVSYQTFLKCAEDVFHGSDYTIWYTKQPYGQMMISDDADFARFLDAIHKDLVVRRDGKVVVALLSQAEAFKSPEPAPNDVDMMATDIQNDVPLPQRQHASRTPSPPIKRKRGRPPKGNKSVTAAGTAGSTVSSRSGSMATRSQTAGKARTSIPTVDAYKKSTLQKSAVKKATQKRRRAAATSRTELNVR